jgi:thiol-disulfide isomerase/thioredoxin
MKTIFYLLTMFYSMNCFAAEVQPLTIGSNAPDFKLQGADGKKYSLKKFKKAEILAVVFTCNHCPTAQAYEDRIIKMANEYKSKGVQVIAISPNDPKGIRLDELGYSDLSDGLDDMKIRAAQKKFPFPYLYDGVTQEVAKLYGPLATPHIFIFDKMRKLQYQGRIDDTENPSKPVKMNDAINALNAMIAGVPVAVPTTKVFGCSIKWASKSSWIEDYKKKWAAEEVTIDEIDDEGIKDMLANKTDKLRVINVWATWCGPCVAEFPDLVELHRIYRDRDFELITISADEAVHKEKALKFLKKQQASTVNYIYKGESKYSLIDAIGSEWQGALPVTLIVEPGGKVTAIVQGEIDKQVMKTKIVDSVAIGRFYR